MSAQEMKLKAIADAIRAKDGTVDPIPANDFPARILALETNAVPEGTYMITLEPSGPEGGAVSGRGFASEGMTVTVRADAADGYKFTGWQEDGQTISEDAEYAFEVMGDRMLIAMFEVAPQGRLPDGYTEVEYIETSGQSGIDTLLLQTATTNFIIDVEPLINSPGSYLDMKIASGYYWSIYWGYNKGAHATLGFQPTDCNPVADISSHRMLLRLDISAKLFYENGVSAYCSNAGGIPGQDLIEQMGVTIKIFEPTDVPGLMLPAKLYSCQIYDGEVATRDFVPCIDSTGAVGLYDLVGGQFYGNAGTGEFTAGPAV